ncbi:MAG: hypothetical protein IH859_06225 [Chloroflexi bacterium]|nr:hypothetical protein [Chloroflexota bacterium]
MIKNHRSVFNLLPSPSVHFAIPRQMRLRQFVPPVFVLALITSTLLPFSPTLKPLSLAVYLLYVFTFLIASLYTSSKHGWKYLLLLPATFAILHLSYGVGFLFGLFKFWNRWGDKVGKTPTWSGESVG